MTTDLDRLHTLLDSGTPLNWVFTGDSITHGLTHTHGGRSYVDHLHELIRGDLARVQDVTINTAISGWRTVMLLDDFDRRVAVWQPHVVSLMIGTNDCSDEGVFEVIEPETFAASVTEFVARVRERGAIPVLLTPPTIDTANAPERARIAAFAEATRRVASEQNTILIDVYAQFARAGEGHRSNTAWGLLNDPFHPNAAGHATIALEIAQGLGLADDSSRTITHLRAASALGR